MGHYKRLALKNIVNCRDLGGYPCGNDVTKFGRFLRCGIPNTPTQDDLVEIIKYGVTTVIDLRGDWEAENSPSVFKFIDGIDYHHICLLELNVATQSSSVRTLEDSYKYSIDNYKENFAKAINTIADAKKGCILFHCFFGKDRTGLLSAMLLHIAGAMPEDIIADYQTSYTYILSFIEREKAQNSETMWETNEANFRSEANTMANTLNYINEKYGSLSAYLAHIGITPETQKKIRNKFFK